MDGLILGAAAGMGFAAPKAAVMPLLPSGKQRKHFSHSDSDLDPWSAFPTGPRNMDSEFNQRAVSGKQGW